MMWKHETSLSGQLASWARFEPVAFDIKSHKRYRLGQPHYCYYCRADVITTTVFAQGTVLLLL